MTNGISGAAAIAGLGITEMTREYTGDATTLALRAIALALDDAGLTKDDLDGLLVNGGIFSMSPAEPGSRACTECLSESLEWVPASGRATLFTFAVMHQRYHPGFFDEIPYNIAVVELEEGPRLNTNIIGVPNEGLRVGMPLVVSFEEVGEGVVLPKFRPTE